MTKESPRLFILLTCSSTQAWAVPQSCLAEIVTVADAGEEPPGEIDWRGGRVPVLDLGADEPGSWRDRRSGSGLIAVMLGLAPDAPGCWGVAVRSTGLGISELAADDVEDAPEEIVEHARAAFRLGGALYQVPDLPAWQRTVQPHQTGEIPSCI